MFLQKKIICMDFIIAFICFATAKCVSVCEWMRVFPFWSIHLFGVSHNVAQPQSVECHNTNSSGVGSKCIHAIKTVFILWFLYILHWSFSNGDHSET